MTWNICGVGFGAVFLLFTITYVGIIWFINLTNKLHYSVLWFLNSMVRWLFLGGGNRDYDRDYQASLWSCRLLMCCHLWIYSSASVIISAVIFFHLSFSFVFVFLYKKVYMWGYWKYKSKHNHAKLLPHAFILTPLWETILIKAR